MKLLPLLMVLFINTVSVAQKMYRYGSLIDQNGDTLSGQISFDHWKDPEKIFFKGKSGRIVRYSLSEVRKILFPGSDSYKRIIDAEGPKVLHTLVDGEKVQLYEQLGDYHYYIGFGQRSIPVLLAPAAFKPLPRNNKNGEREYIFQYSDPRKGFMADRLIIKGNFFSKSFLTDFAYKLNGGANIRSFTPFHSKTHFVPYFSAGRAQISASESKKKTWLSGLEFNRESMTYIEGGVDIYNKWKFKGLRFRLSASYMPSIAFRGQSPTDSTKWTLHFKTRQSLFTVGTSILYGRSLGTFSPYAYLGVSCKLQVVGDYRPALYLQYGNEVMTFTNELKYYKAGLMPGFKAGMLLTNSGRIELSGFYDWAYLLAYSKSNGYGIFQNVAGVGIGYHFSRKQQDDSH